ncbi:MAG: S-layer homology domain-containing protein [Peptococcales bacterium]|jgi:hypothetical protein
MFFSKKHLIIMVFAISFLLVFTVGALASSLEDIYKELETGQFKDDIDKLKANGASEGSIKAFIDEISNEIGDNNGNFEEKVGWTLIDMYWDNKYPDLFSAVKTGWGLSEGKLLDELAENGPSGVYEALPSGLKNIGDFVKDKLTDSEAPGGPGGPGGGGPIVPPAPLPNVPQEPVEKEPEIIELITFADIQGHWAQKDIEFLASRKLVSGVAIDRFDPERAITRAEFASMLIKLLNIDAGYVQESKFIDVSIDAWYAKTVNAASNFGLVAGVAPGIFEPERTITRQEMMAMVSRALRHKGIDISIDETVINDRLAMYSDAELLASWAKEVAVIAINNGIISGRTQTTLAPLENATRAEAAVIMKRIFNKID